MVDLGSDDESSNVVALNINKNSFDDYMNLEKLIDYPIQIILFLCLLCAISYRLKKGYIVPKCGRLSGCMDKDVVQLLPLSTRTLFILVYIFPLEPQS